MKPDYIREDTGTGISKLTGGGNLSVTHGPELKEQGGAYVDSSVRYRPMPPTGLDMFPPQLQLTRQPGHLVEPRMTRGIAVPRGRKRMKDDLYEDSSSPLVPTSGAVNSRSLSVCSQLSALTCGSSIICPKCGERIREEDFSDDGVESEEGFSDEDEE